jgi:hypothetical protein
VQVIDDPAKRYFTTTNARASCASRNAAMAAGVDAVIVSKRLGHGSPNTTWQTYQHVVAGMQTDAAEKVAALIFGPSDRHLKLVSGEEDDQLGPEGERVRRLPDIPSSRSSQPRWPVVTSGPRRTAQPGTCAGLAGTCGHSVTKGPQAGPSRQRPQACDLRFLCRTEARGGGLEPPMAGPEPAVLPITPPPIGRASL